MATRKKSDKRSRPATPERHAASHIEPQQTPLQLARGLSGLLLAVGVVMFGLGCGIAVGRIKDGWGFPMSAVPNWGSIWGLVLMAAGAAYVWGPISLFRRPDRGSISLNVICGLSLLLGTPVITTSTEILYNLFQETKSRPEWVDSVWGFFMFLHVGILIALYRAYPLRESFEDPITG